MKLRELSQLITPDIAKDILVSLGVNIKKNYNFSIREDDKNPSASMYIKNGKVRIHDFGAGFDGDLIDTLKEFFNLSYQEVKNLIASYLGLSKFDNIDIYKKEFKPLKKDTLTYRQIESIWKKCKPLSSISEKKAKEVINKLIPVEYFITAKKKDKKAFYNAVRYDPVQNEPVVATFTPAGKILSIRHRRYKAGDRVIKWKSLKDTEANKYTQIRIKNNDPIFIIEGTHDYTTALLLGINFIALPSKNYKIFKSEELALLKAKYDFIVIPDLDFKNEKDEKYKRFKEELANSLKNLIPQLTPYIKKTITIWDLKKRFFHFKGIEKVKDLSDLCAISDLYDSTYLRVFHLLASFIAKDQTDLEKG